MPRRRGALLLEVVIALAVLVGFGSVILASVLRAQDALDRARRLSRAEDLARSALTELGAGLRAPEELAGPVREERDASAGETGAAFEDAPPEASAWELLVETTPAPFEGLSVVSVTARETSGVGAGREGGGGVSFTLSELVALRGREAVPGVPRAGFGTPQTGARP